MKKIYTVYDSKAASHSAPFFVANSSIAIRDFEFVINDDSTTQIARTPEDFTLYELGEFDEETAAFALHEKPVYIVVGSALKRKTQLQEV